MLVAVEGYIWGSLDTNSRRVRYRIKCPTTTRRMILMKLCPHIFLTYAVIFVTTGIHNLAVFLTSAACLLLFVFKAPKGKKEDADEILLPHKVSIIAHRGAGYDAPENTLAAIREAKRHGADAVEFDIDYTADGVPMVIHDSTVDRTTDGTGCINDMNYDKCRKLNASANHWQKNAFPNEVIPTLDEVIQLCLELNLKMYLDVKGSARRTAAVMFELFKKHPDLYKSAIVCSFFPQIVYLVKKCDANIVTALTHRHNVLRRKVDGTEREGPLYKKLLYPMVDVVLEWAQYHWLWYFCGTSAFLVCNQDVSPNTVSHFQERGVQVVVWTVNDPAEKAFTASCLRTSYMTDTLQDAGCGAQKH